MSEINYDEFFSILGFPRDDCKKMAASMKLGVLRHCGSLAAAGGIGLALAVGSDSMKMGQGMGDKRLALATAAGGGLVAGFLLYSACRSIKVKIENELAAIIGKSKGLSTSAIVAKMSDKQRKTITDTAKEMLRLDIPLEQKLEEQRRWEQYGA